MNNFDKIIKNEPQTGLQTKEQKQALRTHFTELRRQRHAQAAPHDWGTRQFLRALEALKIKRLSDLDGKYLVASFFPIKDELNLTDFACPNWLFPRMEKNRGLSWFEYGDGHTGYVENAFGIKEKPAPLCAPYTHSALPLLCFVPGLAASRDGHRLGYGGGYYDTFLTEFKDKVTSVLCLPSKEFVVPSLPSSDHDAKIDLIVY